MLRELASAGRRRAVAVAAAGVGAFVIVTPVATAAHTVRPVPERSPRAQSAVVRASEVIPPADSHQPQGTGLYAVWCTGRGACTAGGNYENAGGSVQPMVAEQVHGTWRRGTTLTLPVNAGKQQYAQVNGVACRSAGNCVAVGNYTYGTAHSGGAFVAIESHGTWAPAFTPQLPSNARTPPVARLEGVACRPDGFCEAVGSYLDKSGQIQMMVMAKPAGQAWGRAAEIAAPQGAAASPDAILTGVACSGPDSCVAVGHYNDAPNTTRGLGVVEAKGQWGRAAGIPSPRGAVPSSVAGFASVSCAQKGSCLAVGVYAVGPSRDRAMSVTASRGRFGQATAITAAPPSAATDASTALSDVWCAHKGLCVAAGVATNAAGHYVAMYAIRVKGHWTAVFLAGPADVSTGKSEQSSLFSVACADSRRCTAVGYYNDDRGGYSASAVPIRLTRQPPDDR
jgi:hypothetical protein